MKIIVIGGVAGGASCAARLRRLNDNAEIIMIEKGPHISFANCGLPYYIGNVIEDRDKLFVQTVEGLSGKYNLDIRINSEVIKVDSEAKTIEVKTENNTYIESFDYLVLSPGASPYVPNITGINSDKTFTLRNMLDVDKIKNYINEKSPKKAVIVGAGYIGLEMVENLRNLDIDVTLIERNDQLMTCEDFEMTTKIEGALKENSVEILFNTNIKEVVNKDNLEILLDNDNTINADMIILATGITPNTDFIKTSGIELSDKGYIVTDSHMRTNNEFIYACGDAALVHNLQTYERMNLSLAGPASRQARIVADNIMGKKTVYNGVQCSSIIKIFNLIFASTGKNEKELKKMDVEYEKSYTHTLNHTGYYPDSAMMMIKLLFEKETGIVLGASIIGSEGVDKRVDVLSIAVRKGLTVYDLQEFEFAYSPPFNLPKDPVNIAGYVASNILDGTVKVMHIDQLDTINKSEYILIDVRGKEAYDEKHIEGASNIPLGKLKENMNAIPKDKKILLNCKIGLTSYLAYCILSANGYEVYNLSGGILTYNCFRK